MMLGSELPESCVFTEDSMTLACISFPRLHAYRAEQQLRNILTVTLPVVVVDIISAFME
jgi:hypothetical protein